MLAQVLIVCSAPRGIRCAARMSKQARCGVLIAVPLQLDPKINIDLKFAANHRQPLLWGNCANHQQSYQRGDSLFASPLQRTYLLGAQCCGVYPWCLSPASLTLYTVLLDYECHDTSCESQSGGARVVGSRVRGILHCKSCCVHALSTSLW